MKSPLLLSISIILSFFLFLPSFLHVSVTSAASFLNHPFCQGHERLALLQFKQSFMISNSSSSSPSAYPKIESWKLQGRHSDCCTWDGVDCDNSSGHVIGLDLSRRFLRGSINSSSSLFHLVHLRKLNLADNNFNRSEIPSSFGPLSELIYLNLSFAAFSGPFPFNISQLFNLTSLSLSHNMLQGPIPDSIFQLGSLQFLDLSYNNLSGTMELDAFLKLQNLTNLNLSYNKLSFKAKSIPSTTHRKFVALRLGSCNLGHFPSFLRDQDRLEWLDLSDNRIHGMIPSWVWSIGQDTLKIICLASNFLTGFEHRPVVLRWLQLDILDLKFNTLQGPLPIPPQTIRGYYASGNNFTGEISSAFCNLTNLIYLDLYNNNLSGVLPPCLEKSSASLELLILESNLKVLMLGGNQGQVPRSLAYCTKLENLDLGNNQTNYAFPSWLASVQHLKILILRSNRFNGILSTESESSFPLLWTEGPN